MDPLDIELYKTLKAESSDYHAKIQGLWLQKLTLTGVVVGFVIANREELDAFCAGDVSFWAVLLVPVLAILLDMKLLEYGLHVRTISRFISRRFEGSGLAADWEQSLWGDVESADRPMVWTRSGLTVLSAVVPTAFLILIASMLLARSGTEILVLLGAASIAYAGIAGVAVAAVFRAH